MRIGAVSDIHVDINKNGHDEVTPAIIQTAVSMALDLLIIAGDVSSDYKIVLDTLNRIESGTGIPCLYVPGNHDIWNEYYPDKDSWEIYDILKSYSHNLAGGSYEINSEWVVLGDLGWYDFSFGDPSYSFDDFSRMQYGERIWQDSIKAKWDRSVLEMNDYFLKKLEDQIIENSTKNIILVTHVLPIQEFTVQPPNDMWKYLNAFLGSREYGLLAERYPAVRYSVSGHVHYRKQVKLGETEFLCSCLGYRNEWPEESSAENQVAESVAVFEI